MQEKVYFQNSKGKKLCGILADPDKSVNRPVVILCHGFGSSKNSEKYIKLEPLLNNQGLATLRFDFYGHGESEGNFEDITISEAVDDVMSAYKFVEEKFPGKKIGLFGNSFGGMACLIAAAELDNLLFLVLISPVSDYLGKLIAKHTTSQIKEWQEKGYTDYIGSKGQIRKLKYSFYEDAGGQKVYEIAGKIKAPTFIIHGDQDESVPLEQSQRVEKSIPNCKLEIMLGADHLYTNPEHFQKMINLVLDFVVSHATSN